MLKGGGWLKVSGVGKGEPRREREREEPCRKGGGDGCKVSGRKGGTMQTMQGEGGEPCRGEGAGRGGPCKEGEGEGRGGPCKEGEGSC
jgi:hypothetical protein